MKRPTQFLFIGTFLPLCWLLMQAVHELGHVVYALAAGTTIAKVVLHPLTISQTGLFDNSRPLWFVWAGPLVGAWLPLMILASCKTAKFKLTYMARFFAGFCLIANGAYMAFGSFQRIGDAGDAIRGGSPVWLLWLFGAVAIPYGLWLWNGLGPQFGLGAAKGAVDPLAAYVSCAMLVLVVILEVSICR
jgi:hypothetical protein